MPDRRNLPSAADALGLPEHALQNALRNGLSLWTRATGNAFTLVAIEEIVTHQIVALRRAASERTPAGPPAPEPGPPPRHWSDRD